MKPSTLTPVLMSKLLDLHLTRAIDREKLKDRVMRKFVQLAEDIEQDLKDLDNDADELQSRRIASKERARGVVNDHHKIQDRINEGIAAMERVADAAGITRSNTRTAAELAEIEAEDLKLKKELETDPPETPKPGEDSGNTSEASFQPKV